LIYQGAYQIKKLLFVLLLGVTLVLGACGSDTTKISDDDSNNSKPADNSSQGNQEEDSNQEEQNNDQPSNDENVQEDDDLKVTNTYTNKELGVSGTTGPFNYEFSGVQLKKIEVKSEYAASMLDAKIGDTVHAITIQASAENTSEDDMTFYLGQATIITNTKEQLEPDMFLSEHIEGEYLGQVRHEGFNVYVLKNSTVDDLTSIEVRVNAPIDADWNNVGDDVKQTFEVNK